MRGTNERRSIVDDGWEPVKPEGPRLLHLIAVFGAAMVVVPAVAFAATYLLLSR